MAAAIEGPERTGGRRAGRGSVQAAPEPARPGGCPGLSWTARLLALAALVCGPPGVGGQGVDDGTQRVEAGRRMEAQRLEGDIEVDGRMDEAAWSAAPSYGDWVQKEPVEGAPAVNDTEVRLLFDDEALYVGALLYDERPSGIARNMARRDAAYSGKSDYFEVMLDPNLDRRTGYRFRVTAAGVQTDRYLFDDDGEDAAWDAVYETGVTIHERGWTVEMRIPLSQIRYETTGSVQTWGVNFGRRRSGDNELTRFSLVSKLRRGRVSQFGYVEGLDIEGSLRRLELRPFALTRVHRGPAEADDPFFDGTESTARAGLDLSYGLGTAFTLDAAINPDFGQVEADPAVINLSAFETFFRERRPFFVEDARVFDFSLSGGPNSLFYTRRIGRRPQGSAPPEADFVDAPENTTILGAAKLTGRTRGGLSVGALAAVTQAEEGRAYVGSDDALRRFRAEPRSVYGVARLRQDLRDGQSTLGGIVTGARRTLPEDGAFDHLTSEALTAGADFEHTWSDREWALWGFLAGSHVRGDSAALIRIQHSSRQYRQRPDLEWTELDSAATSMTGLEWRMQFERRVGHWTGAVWAAQRSPGFEVNDLGFSTAPERLDGGLRIGYQEVSPGRLFREWSVDGFTFQNWSHEVLGDPWSLARWDWAQTSGTVATSARATFHNFWTVSGRASYVPDRMSRDQTRGGPRMEEPGAAGLSLGFGTDNREVLSVRPRLELTRGRRGSGDETTLGVATTLQPSARLLVQVEPRWTRRSQGAQYVTTVDEASYAPTYGPRYLFADLERRSFSMVTRANWTFTPTLSLELFAQPLLSAGDYVTYKQLERPESFDFDVFREGEIEVEEGRAGGGPMRCVGGRTCQDAGGVRHVDFDGDGRADHSFADRDFNVRSLRATAVLRWEYRPGSRIFLVWQRRQSETAPVGDFAFGRDAGALFDVPADDVLIVKADLWWSW